jgi:hypothetical protein
MATDDFCGHIIDQVFAKRCSERYQLFDVWHREGTGMYLVEKPHTRCKTHVLALVSVYARMEYDSGYLEAVLPHGVKLEGRPKALR